MKNNKLNLRVNKDLLKRKKYLRQELLIYIYKSFFYNNNIQVNLSLNSYAKILFWKKKTLTKQTNVCLITGKYKTNLKFSSFSRHATKRLLDVNLLQNIKRSNF